MPLEPITFITGNSVKFQTAQAIMGQYDLEIVQEKIDTPEIQSLDINAIADFSVQWAMQRFNRPMMKTDVGHYITGLNGFPGPFVKYTNQMLSPEGVLRLAKDLKDRTVILKECLAYAVPGQATQFFITEQKATLAHEPAGSGTVMDQILILDGYDKTIGSYPKEVIVEHWQKSLVMYHDLARYIVAGT